MSTTPPHVFALPLTPRSAWLTPLHADIIFGHLCWKIMHEEGEGTLNTFLEHMKTAPICTLSDVLPTFPCTEKNKPLEVGVPRPILACENTQGVGDPIEDMENLKRYIKKTAFIPAHMLTMYQRVTDATMSDIREKILPKGVSHGAVFQESFQWKNAINRHTGRSEEGVLYAPREYFSTEKKESGIVPRTLYLLVRVYDEDKYEKYHIQRHLEAIFREGYGKRKSIGRGVFTIGEWCTVTDQFPKEGKHLLLLSSFVPRASDPTDGMYQLRVKYGKLGETRAVEGNHHKKPLVMVRQGATFTTPTDYTGYVGRMVDGLSKQYSDVLDYGYGFTVEF